MGVDPMTLQDGKRGPHLREPKPWEAFDNDGNLNLGSFAIGAAMGFVLLAQDLLRARAKVVQTEQGGEYIAPHPDEISFLTRRLLDAADQVQIAARPDGTVDRLATSHSRARAVVRAALDLHPVPWDRLADDDLDAWSSTLVHAAIGIMDLAVDAREPDPTVYWRFSGWADQEDYATFLAMVKERSASLPDEAQAALKIWLRDQGWKTPYRRDELDAWTAHLDQVEADLEATDEIEPSPGPPPGATAPAPPLASTGTCSASDVAAAVHPEGAPPVDAGPSDHPDEGICVPAGDGAGAGETEGRPTDTGDDGTQAVAPVEAAS